MDIKKRHRAIYNKLRIGEIKIKQVQWQHDSTEGCWKWCKEGGSFQGNELKKTLELKTQLKFLRDIIDKEVLENVTLMGYIKSKESKEKQLVNYLTSLYKCMAEQGLITETKDKLWRSSTSWRLKAHTECAVQINSNAT